MTLYIGILRMQKNVVYILFRAVHSVSSHRPAASLQGVQGDAQCSHPQDDCSKYYVYYGALAHADGGGGGWGQGEGLWGLSV